MLDSRKLKVGDLILLAYNHKGRTVPPDRIVRITYIDDDEFGYNIEGVKVTLATGVTFMDPKSARVHGVTVRTGRRIKHGDFIVNMALKSSKQGV